ncbi:MAG: hypothetical protein A2X08_01245 [Bacteroidetes bacterium GWA2_32_17]|nr:MAG: hypothetical protein A2X08_01245 [Bacteroidetes bacterium GWA2_32_17]
MKKIIFVAFAICSGVAFGNKFTIINSGFTFSPDSVSINFGDTVVFQLGATHNAVEVSQSTWNTNGTTALPGGFSTPFTGGQVTTLSIGTHYYVCTNHAFMGMKGRIIVTSNLEINNNFVKNNIIYAFPNPTTGKIKLKSEIELTNSNNVLTIYNIVGEKINNIKDIHTALTNEFDFSSFPKGLYFLEINAENKSYIIKIIVD